MPILTVQSYHTRISTSLKPSLSSQWSLVQSFVRVFVCISYVWEQSHTKRMKKKSHTKLHTGLLWLERLGLSLNVSDLVCPKLNMYFSNEILQNRSLCCHFTKAATPVVVSSHSSRKRFPFPVLDYFVQYWKNGDNRVLFAIIDSFCHSSNSLVWLCHA